MDFNENEQRAPPNRLEDVDLDRDSGEDMEDDEDLF